MKKNDYQNMMEHIQPPAGLNDRVLSAARRRTAEQEPAGAQAPGAPKAAAGAPGGGVRQHAI